LTSNPSKLNTDYDTSSMSFSINTLDENVDFSDASTSPLLVEGRGQTVYWQNCWVKVYDKGEPEPKEHHEKCSGQGTVPGTIEVVFGSQGGKIKIGNQ